MTEKITAKKTISTIYGEAEFSHSETDKEFHSHNSDYNYNKGYAVLHYADRHDIYKIVTVDSDVCLNCKEEIPIWDLNPLGVCNCEE